MGALSSKWKWPGEVKVPRQARQWEWLWNLIRWRNHFKLAYLFSELDQYCNSITSVHTKQYECFKTSLVELIQIRFTVWYRPVAKSSIAHLYSYRSRFQFWLCKISLCKITTTFCLPAERPHYRPLLLVRRIRKYLNSEIISLWRYIALFGRLVNFKGKIT